MYSDISRSFIIPVLDYSPHSPYNIVSLLDDLAAIPGEVICIFNSIRMYEDLKDHPRIDKYCLNSANAGVSRSWNMGINLSEGNYLFILNADLHIQKSCIDKLEMNLELLHNAVIVGPEGSDLKFINGSLSVGKHYSKEYKGIPVLVDNVSGFCMAIHKDRFLGSNLSFDIRFSPCFMEEWDMGLRVKQSGLACYTVPCEGYEHVWGVSQDRGQAIIYFGREMTRSQIMEKNADLFREKWFPVLMEDTGLVSMVSEPGC